jgi:hypothetical protein
MMMMMMIMLMYECDIENLITLHLVRGQFINIS